MRKILFLTVFLFCFLTHSTGQPLANPKKYYVKGYLDIKNSATVLSEPFIGGFNSTQFQPFDIDNNGIMDMVCFERTDNKILPFIRVKNAEFRYAPEYEQYFPSGDTYYKTADLNSDGKLDIFTLDESSNLIIHLNTAGPTDSFPKTKSLGIMVYRNQYKPPFFNLYNGLALSKLDIPEISDIDGDGDIDIITYDQSYQIYKMYSDVRADYNWSKDTFEFQIMDICFGYFNDFANAINLGQCPYKDKLSPRHSGGASVLMFDNDADGDKEMLLSNIGVKGMTLVENGKKNFNHKFDTMVAYDTIFPRNTVRAASYYFPAGFLVDVDGDTIMDLVTCPNGGVNGIDEIKETNQLWYYRNFGKNNKPDFRFQKENLLIENTLDLGGKTAPAFADYDGDGDMDLFIANNGDFEVSGGNSDRIALYRNTGKKDSPSYEFIASDYLSLTSRHLSDLILSFGDVDGDLDQDLLVGNRTGKVSWYKNTAGKNNPFNLVLVDSNFAPVPAIYGATNSAPAVYDFNNDSLPDLLVGYYYGGVKLFVNNGTKAKPSYTTMPGNAYGIRANERVFSDPNWILISYGNAVPSVVDIDKDGKDEIILGTSYGKMRLFRPFGKSISDSLSSDTSWLWQMSLKDSMAPDFGSLVVPAAADLDGDSIPEILIGNSRGGLHLATAKGSKSGQTSTIGYKKPQFNLYPNPTSGQLTIQRGNVSGNWEIRIYTLFGQELYHTNLFASENSISISLPFASNGVYLAEVTNGNSKTVKKFIVNRN